MKIIKTTQNNPKVDRFPITNVIFLYADINFPLQTFFFSVISTVCCVTKKQLNVLKMFHRDESYSATDFWPIRIHNPVGFRVQVTSNRITGLAGFSIKEKNYTTIYIYPVRTKQK